MQETCIVGYCPKLYDALQSAVHEEMPHELVDIWPNLSRQYDESDRQAFIEMILDGLVSPHDEDYDDIHHYITTVYEAIDDLTLAEMIENETIQKLMVNEFGYYLAVKECEPDEADLHQRR